MSGKTWQTAARWWIRWWDGSESLRSAWCSLIIQQRLNHSFISALSDNQQQTLGCLHTLPETTVERRNGTEKNNTLHFCTRAFIGAKRLQEKETHLYKELYTYLIQDYLYSVFYKTISAKRFYNRFIYCSNLIYLTYGIIWLILYIVWGVVRSSRII